MTAKFSRYLICRKSEGNIGEAVEYKVKLCNEVDIVRELTYLGDRVSAGGWCEATVNGSTGCGLGKFIECGELLYGRIFSKAEIGCL